VSSFAEMVARELAKARAGHTPINSLHEGYAVIAEELDELWGQVRMRGGGRSAPAMLAELVQIGAMAQRCAEDLRMLGAGDHG